MTKHEGFIIKKPDLGNSIQLWRNRNSQKVPIYANKVA
jgi:hypothetical protein